MEDKLNILEMLRKRATEMNPSEESSMNNMVGGLQDRDQYLSDLRESRLAKTQEVLNKQTPESLDEAQREAVRLGDQGFEETRSFEDLDKEATANFNDERFKRILESLRK